MSEPKKSQPVVRPWFVVMVLAVSAVLFVALWDGFGDNVCEAQIEAWAEMHGVSPSDQLAARELRCE